MKRTAVLFLLAATAFGARVRLTNAARDKDYGNESNKQKEPAGDVVR